MSDSKNRSASRNLGDSVIQAGQLQDSSYKNQASLPTQSENDAQLFADIGKSFSAPGDRPRGGARNLGAGFAKGLEYGAKSNAISEKKENFGKYQKQMDYLKSVQGEVVKQNQWHAEQEKRLETVKPFAVGGLEISYSGMDYATGNDRMRNVMEQAKLADPTIKGDYIGYVPNSPIVNMRDQEGNIIAYSLSNLAGEDVVKRVQENYIKQQQSNTSNDAIDVKKYKQGIPGGAYGTKNENANNPYGSIPLANLKTGGGGRAFMNTLNSEINLAKDIPIVLDQLQEAEDIIKKNPAIGTSWNNWVSKGSFSKGFMDKDLRHAYEKLGKIAARVEETYVKAKGSSITDAERETIKKGLFDTSLQGRSSQFNINSVRKELAIAAQRGEFAADELLNGRVATSSSFNKFINSQGQQSPSNEGNDSWSQLGKKMQ